MSDLKLKVIEAHAETDLIRHVELASPDGAVLPAFTPGAHIKIRLPDESYRHYSLISTSVVPSATRSPMSYRLGVRLEEASKGGSLYMHALKVGDTVAAAQPTNDFPLVPSDRTIVLLAGGIGVTPIMTMAATMRSKGYPFRFIYAGRSRSQLAFLREVETISGTALQVHADDEAGRVYDVRGLMASLTDREPLYLCGPTPMLQSARDAARDLGWQTGRLRFEVFVAPAAQSGDAPFEVVLKSTGQTFAVPKGKTILEVLEAAGADPLHDCRRGECGVCQVAVVEGTPDHRDYVLSDTERAGGKVMQICISRSRTPRLVIDL